MLLRASGQPDQKDYDLNSVTDGHIDPGVDFGHWLRSLTEAAIRNRWDDLATIRDQAGAAMGTQSMVDALVVASGFNGITRVADATGIPLDENTQQMTVDMRESTGIERFNYAEKSDRFDFVTT
ncbi:MAG TPA: hypothetical protein EYO78_00580 [Gammaproteobacteria bacterium]|nr:hypothetical protein [Gammaproteobacteria bacterium]|tara:strand:- start:16392 stop:16763 length:372 start_codon:yes stop_codon:yes gene_type:complete